MILPTKLFLEKHYFYRFFLTVAKEIHDIIKHLSFVDKIFTPYYTVFHLILNIDMIDEKKTVVQTNHVLRLFIQLKGRKPNEDGNVLGE